MQTLGFGYEVLVKYRDDINSASHSCFKLTVTFKTLHETRCLQWVPSGTALICTPFPQL